jgi:hypothetical protein
MSAEIVAVPANLQMITGACPALTATDAELLGHFIGILRRRRRRIAKEPGFQGDEGYVEVVKAVAWRLTCEEFGALGCMIEGARLKSMEAREREHMARFLR